MMFRPRAEKRDLLEVKKKDRKPASESATSAADGKQEVEDPSVASAASSPESSSSTVRPKSPSRS